MDLVPRRFQQLTQAMVWRLTPSGRKKLRESRYRHASDQHAPGLTNPTATGTVDVDDIAVQYYQLGCEQDPDATVVFVHGFTLTADSFFLQIDHLRERYPQIRSLAVDLRGHGETGEVDPRLCTISGAADDVYAAISARTADEPLILVGHSLGGFVVFNMLRRYHEHLAGRIKGLVLVDTAIDSFSAQGVPQVLASPIADMAYNAVEAAPEVVQKYRDSMSELLGPALATSVFKAHDIEYPIVEFHAEMIRHTPLATLVGFFDDLQEHEELAAAQYLRGIPGFILVGKKDIFTPVSQSERIHEVWPYATLKIVADTGHMLPLEQPELLSTCIDELIEALD
ncbi:MULTISPECIES: alpha/beta fold hydrolase [Corynebacterium]|uniref:alpha/beta fold hydrolase n=1 Tax=Corynebacterium TaxID=1716 RepID=UPI00124F4CD2|nr:MULTISPECIES: alpha/beta hydrolase [Corynebacterium]